MLKKLLALGLFAYFLIPLFDKDLYTRTELERIEVGMRTRYYTQEMGVLYSNNVILRAYLNRIFPFANKYFYKLAHP